MIITFLREIVVPYFSQWKSKIFVNIFRYLLGIFLECFPISSSLINSLFYKTSQEKSIEKDNINIHFITGISGLLFFIFLRWQWPEEGLNYPFHLIPMVIIPFIVFIHYYIIQYSKFFYIIPFFFIKPWEFSWEIYNISQLIIFIVSIYNLSNIIGIFNDIFKIFHQYFKGLWFKILSFMIIYWILKLWGTNFSYHWFILFLSLWKTQLFHTFIQGPWKNLMTILFFFNNWYQDNLLNIYDFIIPTGLFTINLFIKYIKFRYPSMIIGNETILVFLLAFILLFSYLLLWLPVVGFNYYVISILGLIMGFPLVHWLKQYIFKNKNIHKKNLLSLQLNIIITIFFTIILLIKNYYGFPFQLHPIINYFIIGFFNSWALIPGFSRMLMTFLTGFVLNMDIKNIVLINYCLLVTTSLGQWFLYSVDNWKNLSSIPSVCYKKFQGIISLFSHSKNLFMGFGIFTMLIGISFSLMKSVLIQIMTPSFWIMAIFLRLTLAITFIYILQKKSINTQL